MGQFCHKEQEIIASSFLTNQILASVRCPHQVLVNSVHHAAGERTQSVLSRANPVQICHQRQKVGHKQIVKNGFGTMLFFLPGSFTFVPVLE